MRKLVFVNSSWTGLLLAVTLSTSALAQVVDSAYQGGSDNSCSNWYGIKVQEPASGQHPLFIYVSGTQEPYNSPQALQAIAKAADLGFVGASVQYDNAQWVGSCDVFRSRSKCIFDKSTQKSAIEVLCSRARADCSKGIVLAGFSQGFVLSVMARNFDPRVRAVYGMGAGVVYANGTSDVRACVSAANRDLPNNRLRVVNGEGDQNFYSNDAGARANLKDLTGLACPGKQGCFNPNDSGWFIVPNSASSGGDADHCYMRYPHGCDSWDSDVKWSQGTYEWSLSTNLRWLKSFTDGN